MEKRRGHRAIVLHTKQPCGKKKDKKKKETTGTPLSPLRQIRRQAEEEQEKKIKLKDTNPKGNRRAYSPVENRRIHSPTAASSGRDWG
jgi:hypothetical protein